MNAVANYADILLPLPVEGYFTYYIPEEFQTHIKVGCRVVVQFGASKKYTGVVVEIHGRKPESYRVKNIVSLLDSEPVLKPEHLAFWKWVSSYYLCSEGEVMKAALPSVLTAENGGGLRSFLKTQTFVGLAELYKNNPDSLGDIITKLGKAKKQQELLIAFAELSGLAQDNKICKEVSKAGLLGKTGITAEVLRVLCRKGILELYEKEESRIRNLAESEPAELNRHQAEAIESIRKVFEKNNVCLLHGYTSSGKTEIYMHLIEECISCGRQALMLVPEIALTTQLAERLRRVFGDKLGVYHSGISDSERMLVWNDVANGDNCSVVLGARSSVFLPFRSLGLVVIDEEHETSYKQQDPAPRYNARNAAMMLASIFKAKTLLGTATPSVESYSNCLMGKSGLVELFSRHMEVALPEVKAVNTRDLRRRKRMKSIFSPLLVENIREALATGDKVILFQNRRGYSPIVECESCGWIPKCMHCDVTLTYHRNRRKLCCHYCGFEMEVPEHCPSCGSGTIRTHGIGTERVEEEATAMFPDARVVRMDSDTTGSKHSFERIIREFESGDKNILIGTQMVSKGLDFRNVSVVGIINADMMMSQPDFRAGERAYQLMSQVSGRAGRDGKKSTVIIQTSNPENPVIRYVISGDFKAFFNDEVSIRKAFGYPPYTRLVNISFRHHDVDVVRKAALYFSEFGRRCFGVNILGPDQPPVSRIKNLFLQSLLLKIDISESVSTAKSKLVWIKDRVHDNSEFRYVQIIFDVDPV